MSVSLAFLPYHLALRSLMGEKNFENWIHSNERIYLTPFQESQADDLQLLVERAGLDFIDYGGVWKTHICNTYFFWQKENGYLQAVFFVNDPPQMLQETQQRLSAAYGARFLHPLQQDATNKFHTEFTNLSMLKQALATCGLIAQIHSPNEISCMGGGIRFSRSGEEPFYIQIEKIELHKAFRLFSDIDDSYRQCVQENSYREIINNLQKHPRLSLLNEYVEEDNTIVLTVSTNE